MFVDAATERALERIAERAADVARAFTPGAVPNFGDVAKEAAPSQAAFDPLCVAPPEDAYFLSRDDRGRTVYTRDGDLRFVHGVLTGPGGQPILGFASPARALGELRIDPVDLALGRAGAAQVEPDGSVVYERTLVDPRSGARERERVSIGRVALARFPAATRLAFTAAGQAPAPEGIVPHVGLAGDGNFALLAPMRREASRIDFDRSLERLKDAYLALDALAAAHKAQDGIGKTAMDLLK